MQLFTCCLPAPNPPLSIVLCDTGAGIQLTTLFVCPAGFPLGSIHRECYSEAVMRETRKDSSSPSAHKHQPIFYFPQKQLVPVPDFVLFYNPQAPSEIPALTGSVRSSDNWVPPPQDNSRKPFIYLTSTKSGSCPLLSLSLLLQWHLFFFFFCIFTPPIFIEPVPSIKFSLLR